MEHRNSELLDGAREGGGVEDHPPRVSQDFASGAALAEAHPEEVESNDPMSLGERIDHRSKIHRGSPDAVEENQSRAEAAVDHTHATVLNLDLATGSADRKERFAVGLASRDPRRD